MAIAAVTAGLFTFAQAADALAAMPAMDPHCFAECIDEALGDGVGFQSPPIAFSLAALAFGACAAAPAFVPAAVSRVGSPRPRHRHRLSLLSQWRD